VPDSGDSLVFQIAIFCRTSLAIVFVAAALPKLAALTAFEGAIRAYELLPAAGVRPASRLIPCAELAVALGLALGLFAPWYLVAAILLLAVFSFALAVNLLRGRSGADCGCFGRGGRSRIGWQAVGRNVALIALSLTPLILADRAVLGWPITEVATADLPEVIVVVAVAGILTILGIAASRLSVLSRSVPYRDEAPDHQASS
jgi:hypothetical protein